MLIYNLHQISSFNSNLSLKNSGFNKLVLNENYCMFNKMLMESYSDDENKKMLSQT